MSSFDAITDFKKLPTDWSFVRSDWGHAVLRHQIEPKTIDSERVFHYSIPSIQATGTGAEENPEEIASNKFLLRGDELLVSKLNPRKGCVLLAEQQELPTICSTEFVVMKPNTEIFDAQFSYYLYASYSVRAYISGLVQSATRSHQRANPDHISKVWLPNPPLETQRRIAAFLDRKTAAIDALIAKKQRLITLLQEKRQALITHAVTKGLNPDAPMKDSGIPWIGDIPEHWGFVPLRFLVNFTSGATPSKNKPELWDGDIPWVSPKDMKRERISDSIDHVSEEAVNDRLKMIPQGTLLIVVRGMILAHSVPTAITDALVTINQDMKAVTCCRRLATSFLHAYLIGQAKHIARMADSSAHGTKKLETEMLGRLMVPLPPVDEQQEIVCQLDQQRDHFTTLINANETQAAKLTEYRQALISAAVTGQLPIPEEAA